MAYTKWQKAVNPKSLLMNTQMRNRDRQRERVGEEKSVEEYKEPQNPLMHILLLSACGVKTHVLLLPFCIRFDVPFRPIQTSFHAVFLSFSLFLSSALHIFPIIRTQWFPNVFKYLYYNIFLSCLFSVFIQQTITTTPLFFSIQLFEGAISLLHIYTSLSVFCILLLHLSPSTIHEHSFSQLFLSSTRLFCARSTSSTIFCCVCVCVLVYISPILAPIHKYEVTVNNVHH